MNLISFRLEWGVLRGSFLVLHKFHINNDINNLMHRLPHNYTYLFPAILNDKHLKNESLPSVTDKDSVGQRMECSEEDRKPDNILNENHIKANLEEASL